MEDEHKGVVADCDDKADLDENDVDYIQWRWWRTVKWLKQLRIFLVNCVVFSVDSHDSNSFVLELPHQSIISL